MIRKHSLKPLPKLKKKAEALFHKWIVKRDWHVCFTCGKAGNEAGHYWHNKLDFDPRNLHCQCTYCNHFLSGNLGKYAVKLIDDFGRKWFDQLDRDAHQEQSKRSRQDLEELIKKFSSV